MMSLRRRRLEVLLLLLRRSPRAYEKVTIRPLPSWQSWALWFRRHGGCRSTTMGARSSVWPSSSVVSDSSWVLTDPTAFHSLTRVARSDNNNNNNNTGICLHGSFQQGAGRYAARRPCGAVRRRPIGSVLAPSVPAPRPNPWMPCFEPSSRISDRGPSFRAGPSRWWSSTAAIST
jgi:hypothetical protein